MNFLIFYFIINNTLEKNLKKGYATSFRLDVMFIKNFNNRNHVLFYNMSFKCKQLFLESYVP